MRTESEAQKRALADEKKKRAINAEIGVKELELEGFVFGGLCIETCRANAKYNERLKAALTYYDTVLSALDRTVESLLHPRKGIKGYEWRNGTKYKINRYGPPNERYYA